MLNFRSALIVMAAGVVAACSAGVSEEETGATEDKLLPNTAILDGQSDGTVYRRIAEHFAKTGAELHVERAGFSPSWPLNDTKTTVLNRLGTPMLFSNIGYFSTGFNVTRSSTITVSDEIRAPHGGRAVAFDWAGNPITTLTNPYGTIVAIHDPVSHVITVLTHINPIAAIVAAPQEVAAGAPIGKLVRAPLPADMGSAANRLANVEVAFLDGEQKRLLDPAKVFEAYKDTTAPEIKRVYVTNDAREVGDKFKNGNFDLIVEAADRDNDSNRNLEVSAIGFSIRDQAGAVVAEIERCEIAGDLFADVSEGRKESLRDLVDFGSAVSAGQIGGAWPQSDVDNPTRTFRYALTHLGVDRESGRCIVKSDADGVLKIPNETTKLAVSVSLWDAKSNETTKSFNVGRIPNSQEFTIGGTVSGLVGEVKLARGPDELVVTENGAFVFARPVTVTTSYTVTVRTQPPSQKCTVKNASGDMPATDVRDVEVSCVTVRKISGTVTGLGVSGVTLQNNGADNKRVTNDGTFTFSKAVEVGKPYKVTIFDQPDDRTCTVEHGEGVAAAFDIENVLVTCN